MAFWTIVQVGFLIASIAWGAYKYYSARTEASRAAGFDSASLPRANEGDPVAIVYGQVRVRAPQIVAFQESTQSPEEVPDVGLAYIIVTRFVLCLSNDRVETAGTLRAAPISIMIGDKELGGFTPEFPPLTGDGFSGWEIVDANIQGGNVLGGGGTVRGDFRFYDGNWNMDFAGADPGTDTNNTPNYRGFVSLRLNGWYVGLSPSIPPYSFVVYNPINIPGYESVSGPLANNQANPAAVVYDILTNPWGRLGIPDALVDVASFAACAATLQDEQHGCSVMITNANSARDVIEQLLKQADATLYTSLATGQLTLELVREDYDPEAIPEYNQTNIIGDPRMPSTLYEETVNEVRVLYTNPVSGYVEASALAQDLALINAQGGRRKTAELRFPWVSNMQTAFELAQRELNFLSRPIAMLTITVNREGFNLRPGSVFRFTWPEWNGYTNVFRVTDINYGTLTKGEIQVTAVQDRFSIQGTTFDPPDDEIGPSLPTADPILLRTVTEAPRWIQLKAYEQGALVNVDAQRGYFLAKPEGEDSRYRVVSDSSSVSDVYDEQMPPRAFPGGATVETEYAKTTSAYDTTTHLRIEGLYGVTLAAATSTEISVEGRNLIQIAGEILAFESATDLGSGVWRLNNVWRGLLDTVPATHAVGAQVYFLPGSFARGALGARVLTHGDDVVMYTMGGAGSLWIPAHDSPEDIVSVRQRVLLPYPAADVTVNGTKAPVALEEGGVTLSFLTRDRLKVNITRGNASAETPEALTTYDAVGVKGDPVTPGAETALAEAISTSSTTQHHVGAVGHGDVQIGVRSRRTGVALSDGSTPLGGVFNWQTPLFDLTAHHWRNLLPNPRFASGMGINFWDQIDGVATTSSSGGLGDGGLYVTGQSGTTVEIRQTIPVAGYLPANYTAILDFFVHNGGDTGDTVTVHLMALDSGGSTLQTETYGPSDPGNAWGKQTLQIDDLHDDTTHLRVRIILTANGELDTIASARVTELCLRAGQVSDQLLLNPSFEAGLTSWTAGGSGMQILSAIPYESTNYTRPQDGASSTLLQDVALPDGYEDGVAVLEFARMNDAADDTGMVTLSFRDGGGELDAVSTADEAISPSNIWQRRRLVFDPIPAGCTTIRVMFTGTRVTGTPNNSCVDDFDLRVHKHLDPDEETQLFEDLAFVEQPLPTSTTDWKQHFPDVPPPDYAIYDGGLVGRLGIEPIIEAGTGCFASGKAVVSGPEGNVTTCYESAGTSTTEDEDIHTAPVGDAFANFGTANPFTVVAFWKTSAELSAACGVVGRVIGSRGWELRLNSDGVPRASLFGASATVSRAGAAITDDGALHGAAMIYDMANEELHLVDAVGTETESTTGMGEIRATSPGKFRIMSSGVASQARLAGQVVRCYVWRVALTASQAEAIIRYTAEPFDALFSSTRTGVVACLTGSDTAGVLVERFGPDRAALALDEASQRVGMVAMPALANLAPADFTSNWTSFGATVVLNAAVDPEGHKRAASITGDNSTSFAVGYTGPLALGSAGTRYLHFFARADVAENASVVLSNAGDGLVDNTSIALTTEWQLFRWQAAWDGSSLGEGYFQFFPSNDGTSRTIYLSPLMFIGGTAVAPWPGTIPIGSPGATSPLLAITPSAQFNREGEIEVELVNYDVAGVIANAHNAADDDDRRRITWPSTGGGDVASEHFDGAGADDTSAAVFNTTVNIAQPWKARLRWNRAGLVDGVSGAFVVLRAEQGATVEQDAGRLATFSATTTAPTRLALLHEDGATSAMAGLVFSARISARERKV